MTWRASAFNAALQRLLACASPVGGQNCQKASGDICPTAKPMRPKPSPDAMRQAVKSRSQHLRGEGARRVRISLHERMIREVYSDAS